MKLIKFRRIAPFVALAATWSLTPAVIAQQQSPGMSKFDAGSFIKELLVLKAEGRQAQIAMWFPFEFFVEAGFAQAGTTRAEVERRLTFLRPYHTIIVQRALTQDDGTTAFASQRDVLAAAVLRLDNGEEIAPLDPDRIPPLASGMAETMKKVVAAGGGERGASMYVLMFPATTVEGKAVIDPSRKARLTLVLKADSHFNEAVIVWHAPFDATNPVPPCHQCKESVSPKWSYCPWFGANLERR
jgi:hypothetical protein